MFFRIPIPRSKPSAPSLSRWWDGRNGWWSPMYEVVHSPMIINHQPNIIHQLYPVYTLFPYDMMLMVQVIKCDGFNSKKNPINIPWTICAVEPCSCASHAEVFRIDHRPTETNFSPWHIRIWCWWYSNMPLYSHGGWWNHPRKIHDWLDKLLFLT